MITFMTDLVTLSDFPLTFRQAAMNITAKYCHNEMEAYGSCVASNPSTWQQECHELKMKVAQCTSSQ